MDELVNRTSGFCRGPLLPHLKITPLVRARAWLDLMLADHGVLRLVYMNRHRVSDRVWRSAQPTPHGLAREKRRGIRTILCVRGSFPFRPWPLEQEACHRHGLDLYKVHLRGREAPEQHELLALTDLLASAEYPMLIHCKSGADRSGFVAAVYLLTMEGRSAEEALRQLSLRYGHLRTSRAGILREVITTYRDEGEARGLGFVDWVKTGYNRDAVIASFKARPFATALADQILRREG
ncbi:MAG: protein tyrosine phosphatase [Hyphomicrobium sp.]|nr:MAG: protein tyrosine phosphatase [Hyphomicrobium sp.]